MKNIPEFSDSRNKSWCIHCGSWLAKSQINRDHAPSKTLLKEPYPDNLPVMQICMRCNSGFSIDEEYFSIFLACVRKGSADPKEHLDPKIIRALTEKQNLRQIIDASKHEEQVHGETRLLWTPDKDRINKVILKNARGHAYFEYGEPMLSEPTHIWATPLENLTNEQINEFEQIQDQGFGPEVGSRMMTRVITGQDLHNGWVIVQPRTYRYSVVQQGLMLVRSIIDEYLATEVYWAD